MIYQLDVYYFLIASPKQLQLQAGGDGHKLRAVVVDVLHDDGNDHLGPESAGGWPDEPEGGHLLPDHLSIVARVECLQSELSGQVPLSDLDPGLPIVPQLPVTPTDGRHQAHCLRALLHRQEEQPAVLPGDETNGAGGLIHPGVEEDPGVCAWCLGDRVVKLWGVVIDVDDGLGVQTALLKAVIVDVQTPT